MTLAQLKEIQQKGRLKLTATASRMEEKDDQVEDTTDEEKNEIIRAELSRTLPKDAAKVETAIAVQKIQDRKFTKSPEGVCMGKAEALVFGPASEELWAEVERVILMHYSSPDLDAARALYGSIIAHSIEGPPVWPMLVAPPGSMKTELLNALGDVPSVHMVDVVTPQTFISGQIITGGKGKPSLLHRIGKSGILVAPDFSTVLAMKIDHRASVLADLRRIYDGQLRKEFGTVDDPLLHTWEGRITFVAAVTPAVDKHYGLFQPVLCTAPDGLTAG